MIKLQIVYSFRDIISKGDLAGSKVTWYLCFKHAVKFAIDRQLDIITEIVSDDHEHFCDECAGAIDD